VKLIPYRVIVRESNEPVGLDAIPTKKGDMNFFDILDDFCSHYKEEAAVYTTIRKTMRVDEFTRENKKKAIHGTVKSGEFGRVVDVYNIETKELTRAARTVYDSEEFPFFFMFSLPPGKNPKAGMLIFQTFRTSGVKMLFEVSLKEYLKGLNERLTVSINSLISTDVIKKVGLADRVLRLRFFKKEVPKEISESHGVSNILITEEHSFAVKRGRALDMLKSLDDIKDSRYPFSGGVEYDIVKLELEDSGTTETITIKPSSRFIERKKINPKLLKYTEGFPTHDSLLQEAEKYMHILLSGYTENTD
jgi:hypothetical protein